MHALDDCCAAVDCSKYWRISSEQDDDNLSGLARIPLVNTYARTPPAVWKIGWMPSPAGEFKTHLPPVPLEHLRERDVLADFVRRVNTFGEHYDALLRTA